MGDPLRRRRVAATGTLQPAKRVDDPSEPEGSGATGHTVQLTLQCGVAGLDECTLQSIGDAMQALLRCLVDKGVTDSLDHGLPVRPVDDGMTTEKIHAGH